MELKFDNDSYFKQLFQNLRPKLQNSKNRIFVTSDFGTLFPVKLQQTYNLSIMRMKETDIKATP